jgi:type I restriction enzyme, S subunit
MGAEVSDALTVPDGWTETTLGALGDYLNGRAFKTSEWSKTGRPIIRIQDLTGSNKNPNHFQGEADERCIVRPGDFLISWSATLGAYIWDGPEAVLNQHIFKVESRINKRFHFHLVRERIAELERNAHGSGMVHVTKGVFEGTPVAIPKDGHTQRMIADIIDAADVSRASAACHLASASRAVGRFRQAVLAAACSGRLTADWRETNEGPVQPAELLIAELDSGRARIESPTIDQPDSVPEAWAWASLGEIADVRLGGTPSRKMASYWKEGVPWLSSGEVANCRISRTKETISESGLANSNAKVYPAGTVLIAMIGEGKTRGQSAILDIEASTNQNVAAVLPDTRLLSSEYLWRWALAQYEVTRAVGRGGNQPALNGQKVRELAISVPPLDEQAEIVRRVDQLLAIADALQKRLCAARERVGRSEPAILAKAFRGELSANGRGGGDA